MKLEPPSVKPVLPEHDIFVATHNSDLTEGRGRLVDHSFYDQLTEAVTAARGIDVQGSNGTVYQITQLLPEKRVKMWGETWLSETGEFRGLVRYEGYTPESGREDKDRADAIKQTDEYREYLRLKEIMERYGVA